VETSQTPSKSVKDWGDVGDSYPGYRGSPFTVQNSGYEWFPIAANGYGTIHPVLDKTPPLQAKEEGPPT
jgi:hypothetical protein